MPSASSWNSRGAASQRFDVGEAFPHIPTKIRPSDLAAGQQTSPCFRVRISMSFLVSVSRVDSRSGTPGQGAPMLGDSKFAGHSD